MDETGTSSSWIHLSWLSLPSCWDLPRSWLLHWAQWAATCLGLIFTTCDWLCLRYWELQSYLAACRSSGVVSDICDYLIDCVGFGSCTRPASTAAASLSYFFFFLKHFLPFVVYLFHQDAWYYKVVGHQQYFYSKEKIALLLFIVFIDWQVELDIYGYRGEEFKSIWYDSSRRDRVRLKKIILGILNSDQSQTNVDFWANLNYASTQTDGQTLTG